MGDEETDYQFVRSFLIDNGELNGIPPHEVFVMGYQLCELDRQLQSDDTAFMTVMDSRNADRAMEGIKAYGRTGRVEWMRNDRSESWITVIVEPRIRDAESGE